MIGQSAAGEEVVDGAGEAGRQRRHGDGVRLVEEAFVDLEYSVAGALIIEAKKRAWDPDRRSVFASTGTGRTRWRSPGR